MRNSENKVKAADAKAMGLPPQRSQYFKDKRQETQIKQLPKVVTVSDIQLQKPDKRHENLKQAKANSNFMDRFLTKHNICVETTTNKTVVSLYIKYIK